MWPKSLIWRDEKPAVIKRLRSALIKVVVPPPAPCVIGRPESKIKIAELKGAPGIDAGDFLVVK